jgi:hypothetical protein
MQATDPAPHEFRLRNPERATYFLIGLIFGGSGLFFAWYAWTQTHSAMLALVGSAGLLATGYYLLALALRSRLVIDRSRVTIRGALREWSADLSEVEGFRTVLMPGSVGLGRYRIVKLELKNGRGILNIRQWPDCAELQAWLRQLTDLDVRDRQALLTAIEQDRELGETPQARLNALQRARRWNIALTAVAITAAVVAVAAAGKWRLGAAMVLALTPIVALYLLKRGPLLFAMIAWQKDPRTNLWLATLASGMGLTFTAIGRDFVSLTALAPWVAVGSLAFILGFYRLGRTRPQSPAFHVIVPVLGVLYGFGLMPTFDTILDQNKPQTYEVQVANMHTTTDNNSTVYFLDFGPWGPFRDENSVTVSQDKYQRTHAGDKVCFAVHPGLISVEWYELTACSGPWGSPTTLQGFRAAGRVAPGAVV